METKVIKKISKAGKVSYEYYINGKKVRTSVKLYVASNATGEWFFSRKDLIGKGNMAQAYEWYINGINFTAKDVIAKETEYLKVAKWELADYEKFYAEQQEKGFRSSFSWLTKEAMEDGLEIRRKNVEIHTANLTDEVFIANRVKEVREFAHKSHKPEDFNIVYYNIENI